MTTVGIFNLASVNEIERGGVPEGTTPVEFSEINVNKFLRIENSNRMQSFRNESCYKNFYYRLSDTYVYAHIYIIMEIMFGIRSKHLRPNDIRVPSGIVIIILNVVKAELPN